MRVLAHISSVLLACVSTNALDAGYGIPAAPLILSQPPVPNLIPQPLLTPSVQAPLPFQLVNSAPLASPVPLASTSVSAPIPITPQELSLPVSLPSSIPTSLPLSSLSIAPAPLPLSPLPPLPAPLTSAPIPVASAPAIPSVPSSQFHAQDEFGQFSFGYENINSRKTESKDAFGVTRGSYEYVDANGVLQTVNYIADPVNGFRVQGTNIPSAPAAPVATLPVAPVQTLEPVTDTPEVAKAKADHLEALAKAEEEISSNKTKRAAPLIAPLSPLPIAPFSIPAPVAAVNSPVAFAAPSPIIPVPQIPIPTVTSSQSIPLTAVPAPVPVTTPAFAPVAAPVPVNPAPITAPSSQFHAQDEFGQFSFGYDNINSRKTESKDAFGVTRGEYQYVDANGVLQTVSYVSDPVNGFRVAGTNLPVAPELPLAPLPVAPSAPEAAALEAPLPVMDTPEVAAAKAEHLKAVEEAKISAEEN